MANLLRASSKFLGSSSGTCNIMKTREGQTIPTTEQFYYTYKCFFTDRGFTIINWKYLLWSSELVQLFTMKTMVCNFFFTATLVVKWEKNKPAEKNKLFTIKGKTVWEKNMLAKRNLGTVFPIQLCTPPTQKITYLVTCKISPVTGRRVCPSGRGAFGSGLVAAEQ